MHGREHQPERDHEQTTCHHRHHAREADSIGGFISQHAANHMTRQSALLAPGEIPEAESREGRGDAFRGQQCRARG